jgi:hypothetical protein
MATIERSELYDLFIERISAKRTHDAQHSHRNPTVESESLQKIARELGYQFLLPRALEGLKKESLTALRFSGQQREQQRQRVKLRRDELQALREQHAAFLESSTFESNLRLVIEARQNLDALDFLLALVPEDQEAMRPAASLRLEQQREKLPLWAAALESEHERIASEIAELERRDPLPDMESINFGGGEASRLFRELDVVLLALAYARQNLNAVQDRYARAASSGLDM